MAKASKKEETKKEEKQVAKRDELQLVPVSVDITEEAEVMAALPKAILEGAEVFDSTLPPSPEWTTPGEFIEGIYLGTKEDVGPNHSMIYAMHVADKDGQQREVAVWGSTNLDDRMRMARPTPGDHLIIIFTGERETQRKQNPVKLFTVVVKRKQ